MSTFPKDGSTFVVECIDRTAYRWAKYKPQGAKQMGKPGRWQKQVINGDWHRWENCEEPVGEISPPAEDGPISKAFKQHGALDQWRQEVGKLHSQVDLKDAQIVVLTERLQAIIDWCDIAMKNADEFDSHGVRNLDGPIFDAARAVLLRWQPRGNREMKLTHQQKLEALSYRFYQFGEWKPKAGDYYTTSRADLEVYQVVSISDGVVRTRFTEGSDAVSEWPEDGFLTDGFGPKRVFVPPWVFPSSQGEGSQ